ncbi:MAG: recombinase RarA [Sulfuricurvum sp. PC08-66]|nr:MAG: recombinase RarA [Sulfuricurvum sp. PC08-66]
MPDFSHLLRPKSFDTLFGQPHLTAPDAPLRRLVEKGALAHIFLSGPPGTGKTSLARMIATLQARPFYEFNATSLKVEELRNVFKLHQGALVAPLIFIDEVHRLSTNQQEVLLPYMERNAIMLIGASTENPYHAVTAAMRSRSLLFELKSLDSSSLRTVAQHAIDMEGLTLDEEAMEYLLASSGGDARALLKLLEFASTIDTTVTKALLHSIRPTALSDGTSEKSVHYDLISALIKSVRGSDENAAIYYLGRLIVGGENPEFIARRLVILASEDIGNANPQALMLATSAMQSVAKIGYPEARIILAQAVIYLCGSPKSNSAYNAINAAITAIEEGEILPIPSHILTHAKTYKYPHTFGGWVAQEYLAKPLHFVDFIPVGYEKKMSEWLDALKNPKS